MQPSKSPIQVLIDEANATNSSEVPYAAVDFGQLEPHNVPEEGNTRILASAVSGKGFTGEVLLTYNRLDIAEVFEKAGIETVEVTSTTTSTAGLVEILRDQYGLIIADGDVVDEPIEYDSEGNAVAIVKIADGAYIYTGELPVSIVGEEAGEVALEDVFKITALNGLNYPTLSVQGLTKPQVEQNQELSGDTVKEDGTMQTGTGNPAGDFVTAGNSELSLAITARRYRENATIPAEDGLISIELKDDQDWNFPFSLSVDPTIEAANRPLTDLYEIFLSAKSLDSGEELVLELVPTAEGYSLRNDAKEIDIVDSFVSENKQVVQNIQRLSFYKAAFPSANQNGAGALVGNFQLTLTARRKNSVAPRVTAVVNVAVTQEVQPS